LRGNVNEVDTSGATISMPQEKKGLTQPQSQTLLTPYIFYYL
jgi:hypothetical protein